VINTQLNTKIKNLQPVSIFAKIPVFSSAVKASATKYLTTDMSMRPEVNNNYIQHLLDRFSSDFNHQRASNAKYALGLTVQQEAHAPLHVLATLTLLNPATVNGEMNESNHIGHFFSFVFQQKIAALLIEPDNSAINGSLTYQLNYQAAVESALRISACFTNKDEQQDMQLCAEMNVSPPPAGFLQWCKKERENLAAKLYETFNSDDDDTEDDQDNNQCRMN